MSTSFVISQGASLTVRGFLKSYRGTAIASGTYDGTESLVAKVWAGGPTPTLVTPSATWDDPSVPSVLVTISAADTATLYAGTYEAVCRIDDGTTNADAFYFSLVVTNGPDGIPPAPTSTSITRLAVETELVDRDTALLAFAGKSTVANGANRFLTGSIASAATLLGVVPTVPGTVTDADLANVPPSKFYLLCDLAEYRLLKNLLTNIAQPDQTSGNTKIQLDGMMQRFRLQMLDLYKQYKAYLGNNESTLSVGSIRLRPPPSCGPEVVGWYGGSNYDF